MQSRKATDAVTLGEEEEEEGPGSPGTGSDGGLWEGGGGHTCGVSEWVVGEHGASRGYLWRK